MDIIISLREATVLCPHWSLIIHWTFLCSANRKNGLPKLKGSGGDSPQHSLSEFTHKFLSIPAPDGASLPQTERKWA